MEYLIGLGLILTGICAMIMAVVAMVSIFAGLAWLYDTFASVKIKRLEIPTWIGRIFNWFLNGIIIIALIMCGYIIGRNIWLG